MRKALRILGGLVIALFSSLLGIHFYSLDGIVGIVLIPTDTTIYAPGYTDSAFRKVKVGMKRDEVELLLGKDLCHFPNILDSKRPGCDPLNVNPSLQVVRYSGTPTDGSYRIRTIAFQADAVVWKKSEIYID